MEQAGAQVAEASWHVLPTPQRPCVLSQVKEASSLRLGLYPTADRGRGLELWWGAVLGSSTSQAENGEVRPSTLPQGRH